MLGFTKKEKSVADTVQYIGTMFAGLSDICGKAIPNEVFGDAYIGSFLQYLTLHAVTVVHGGKVPDQFVMAATMAAALDRIVPGYGPQIVKGLVEVADPTHPLHEHYSVGRHEGRSYVLALMNGDVTKQNEMMMSFRNFVMRNYLGIAGSR